MAASIGAAVAGEAIKTGGEVIKEGAKTIFGALGNLMNEGYEKRKALLNEEIEKDKMKLETELKEKMATLQNDLDEKLMRAKSDEERATIFATFQAKKDEFLTEWNKGLELKQMEWERDDKALARTYQQQDLNREERTKMQDQLKHLIYTAPDPQTRAQLAATLASTLGKGPFDYNDSTYTKSYIDEIASSKGMTQEERDLLFRPPAPEVVPPLNVKGDLSTFTSEPTKESIFFSVESKEYEKYMKPKSKYKSISNIIYD